MFLTKFFTRGAQSNIFYIYIFFNLTQGILYHIKWRINYTSLYIQFILFDRLITLLITRYTNNILKGYRILTTSFIVMIYIIQLC